MDSANFSCTDTARRIGKTIAPSWNDRIMRKNRLSLTADNLPKLFDAQRSHLYLKGHGLIHECIVTKHDNDYLVLDSYIDYRPECSKSISPDRFQTAMRSLDGQTLAALLDLPSSWSGPITGWFVVLRT